MTQENNPEPIKSLDPKREQEIIDEIAKLVAEETLQETEEKKGD